MSNTFFYPKNARLQSFIKKERFLATHRLLLEGIKSQGQIDAVRRNFEKLQRVHSVTILKSIGGIAIIEIYASPSMNKTVPELLNEMQDVYIKVKESTKTQTIAVIE